MINPVSSFKGITQSVEVAKNEQQISNFENVLQEAISTQDTDEIREACMQVEQYMLGKIMKQMKANIESEDPLIPKGDYEKMVEDYLIDEQVKMLCESGGIGLGDMMYKQMLKDL